MSETNAVKSQGEAGSDRFFQSVRNLGPVFADRAAVHDLEASFVADNYADLKEHGFFSAGVPSELGGGGLTHAELCKLLRELAHHCGSTALALSMHQHLVAAAIWRYRRGQPGEALLRKVADNQAVLVSTGGRDWLASNGEMQKVEGGFRVSARKAFASGCQAGDVLVASAQYDDPDEGPSVLHFSVSLSAEGVQLLDDWHTLGMRGTGSRTVILEDVFVPTAAVSLKRAQAVWHPVWAVVLGVAMPLIMSVYLGVAEAAAEITRTQARKKPEDPHLPYLLGELTNTLTTAQMAVDGMVELANNYDFEPTVNLADGILIRKTIATNAVVATAEKALEATGGVGFFQGFGLERLLRDVHAAQFHPLPEKAQHHFTGRLALGLEPVQS